MEQLAVAILQNADVQGIKFSQRQYKWSLYADDLLLYITNPHISLPSIMREFEECGQLRNFKVNYNKSEALNILLSPHTLLQLQSNFSLKWLKMAIKYLGILNLQPP